VRVSSKLSRVLRPRVRREVASWIRQICREDLRAIFQAIAAPLVRPRRKGPRPHYHYGSSAFRRTALWIRGTAAAAEVRESTRPVVDSMEPIRAGNARVHFVALSVGFCCSGH
jgi:hypothetical protein